MSAVLLWFGKKAAEHVKGDLVSRKIEKATDVTYDTLRERLSGSSPSRPGAYPDLVTGEFKASIEKEYSKKKLEGRVGTNDPIGAYLEFGFTRHPARPWLTLIVEEMKSKLRSVMFSRSR